MMWDRTTAFGARVERRLREDRILWLTTVRPDGMPEPSPVWYLWDGETFLIYSKPNTQKLRNLARNPRVALNLNCDANGGDVVILTGEAEIVPAEPPCHEVPEYVKRYEARMIAIGGSPAGFARIYSVPIRVRPTKLRGH